MAASPSPPDPANAIDTDWRQCWDANADALLQQYLAAAGASGKPRGATWVAAEWGGAPAFVRQRASGQLLAVATVNVQFAAIPDGELEDNPNVNLWREATACFHWSGVAWAPNGQTIFNHRAEDVVRLLRAEFDEVAVPRAPSDGSDH